MTWRTERDYGDRHGALKRIEAAAGLDPPGKTGPSGPKVLTYRVISRLLAATLNEREPWDARWGDGRPVLSEFPAAQSSLQIARVGDSPLESHSRFWVISAGSRHLAVLDTDGRVYLSDGSVSRLDEAYAANDRSILRTIAATLGPILP